LATGGEDGGIKIYNIDEMRIEEKKDESNAEFEIRLPLPDGSLVDFEALSKLTKNE